MLSREERVREVFARVRAGDIAVADLYHEDAWIRDRANPPIHGRDAIREFYTKVFSGLGSQPRPAWVMSDERFVVTLLEVRTADGLDRRGLDVFEVDADGIQSLQIFSDCQTRPAA